MLPRLRELSLAPCADWGLLSPAAAADARGLARHVGQIHSADAFYDDRSDRMEVAARHGVLAVEMEASELYTLAARYGARALAVLTVSDRISTGGSLSSAERETGFTDMMEIALQAATA